MARRHAGKRASATSGRPGRRRRCRRGSRLAAQAV